MRRPTGLALLAAISLVVGCHTIEPHERIALTDPLLRFDEDVGEVHWRQKSTYAREGSAGGIESAGASGSVGGGCGCY